MIKHWKRPPREVVECSSLEIFKPQLDTVLVPCSGWTCLSRWLDYTISQEPFQPQPFCASTMWLIPPKLHLPQEFLQKITRPSWGKAKIYTNLRKQGSQNSLQSICWPSLGDLNLGEWEACFSNFGWCVLYDCKAPSAWLPISCFVVQMTVSLRKSRILMIRTTSVTCIFYLTWLWNKSNTFSLGYVFHPFMWSQQNTEIHYEDCFPF